MDWGKPCLFHIKTVRSLKKRRIYIKMFLDYSVLSWHVVNRLRRFVAVPIYFLYQWFVGF